MTSLEGAVRRNVAVALAAGGHGYRRPNAGPSHCAHLWAGGCVCAVEALVCQVLWSPDLGPVIFRTLRMRRPHSHTRDLRFLPEVEETGQTDSCGLSDAPLHCATRSRRRITAVPSNRIETPMTDTTHTGHQPSPGRPRGLDSPLIPKIFKVMSGMNVAIYRTTRGRIGGKWRAGSASPRRVAVCRLHTTGRKTGQGRTP